jgi:hypothetical protein
MTRANMLVPGLVGVAHGKFFKAGAPLRSANPPTLPGRWAAAIRRVCAWGRSAANTSRNFIGAMQPSLPVPPSGSGQSRVISASGSLGAVGSVSRSGSSDGASKAPATTWPRPPFSYRTIEAVARS